MRPPQGRGIDYHCNSRVLRDRFLFRAIPSHSLSTAGRVAVVLVLASLSFALLAINHGNKAENAVYYDRYARDVSLKVGVRRGNSRFASTNSRAKHADSTGAGSIIRWNRKTTTLATKKGLSTAAQELQSSYFEGMDDAGDGRKVGRGRNSDVVPALVSTLLALKASSSSSSSFSSSNAAKSTSPQEISDTPAEEEQLRGDVARQQPIVNDIADYSRLQASPKPRSGVFIVPSLGIDTSEKAEDPREIERMMVEGLSAVSVKGIVKRPEEINTKMGATPSSNSPSSSSDRIATATTATTATDTSNTRRSVAIIPALGIDTTGTGASKPESTSTSSSSSSAHLLHAFAAATPPRRERKLADKLDPTLKRNTPNTRDKIIKVVRGVDISPMSGIYGVSAVKGASQGVTIIPSLGIDTTSEQPEDGREAATIGAEDEMSFEQPAPGGGERLFGTSSSSPGSCSSIHSHHSKRDIRFKGGGSAISGATAVIGHPSLREIETQEDDLPARQFFADMRIEDSASSEGGEKGASQSPSPSSPSSSSSSLSSSQGQHLEFIEEMQRQLRELKEGVSRAAPPMEEPHNGHEEAPPRPQQEAEQHDGEHVHGATASSSSFPSPSSANPKKLEAKGDDDAGAPASSSDSAATAWTEGVGGSIMRDGKFDIDAIRKKLALLRQEVYESNQLADGTSSVLNQ